MPTILSSPLKLVVFSPVRSPLGDARSSTLEGDELTFVIDTATGNFIVDMFGNNVVVSLTPEMEGSMLFVIDGNGDWVVGPNGNMVVAAGEGDNPDLVYLVDDEGNYIVDAFGNKIVILEPEAEVFVVDGNGSFLVDEFGNRVITLEKPTEAFVVDDSGNWVVDAIGNRVVSLVFGSVPLKLLNLALVWFKASGIIGSAPVTTWTNEGRGDAPYDLDVVVGTGANLTRTQINSIDVVTSSGSVGLETT